MKVLYDECIYALRDNKCSECNDFYQCSVCDYFQQRYEQGRADQKEEDNAFFNFEGAWELEKKKVRAEAIDECKTILKIQHMIRTTEDDFCGKVEIPFYRKIMGKNGTVKGAEMTKEEIYKHSMLEQIEKYTTTLAKLDNHYVYGTPLELTGVEILKLRSLVQDKVMMYSKLLEERTQENEEN